MALQDEITRIKQAKVDIKASIEAKGGTVGDGLIDTYASAIDNLPSGGEDIYEYFSNVAKLSSTSSFSGRHLIKKIPDIDISGVTSMSSAFDEFQRLEELNLPDVSEITNMSKLCNNCRALTKVGTLNSVKTTNMNSMFDTCLYLAELGELRGDACRNVSSMFSYCSRLESFGGIKNLGMAYLTTQSANYSSYTLNLSTCTSLTHDSLMNVINGLYDIASLGVQTQKLQLGSTNLAKLTAEEILVATNKGFTVS